MRKDEKAISIVLPVYNGEKYLQEAIDSVLAQNISDWELIIVDDASTDNTRSIIQEAVCNDNRIKASHNQVNLGLPASLNIGFKQSKGAYLTWTSDDNCFLSDALCQMRVFLENHKKIPMVCANMFIRHNDEDVLTEFRKYDESQMYVENYVGACFMYRRNVLQTIGEYDIDLFGVEDYDYWLRILKQYGEIGHLDEYLYVYRMHEKSLTSTKMNMIEKRRSLLMLREFDWIIEKIKNDRFALFSLYWHLAETGDASNDICNRIGVYLPEMKSIYQNDNGKPLILYGAGRTCEKAFNNIPHERIAYIADADPGRYGNSKNGKSIISIEEMKKMQKDYQIIITVGNRLMLEVMNDLLNADIQKYRPYIPNKTT